jgi:hypothetical protein
MKEYTVKQLAEIYGGGVITNDRGNGCGGPGYINENEVDETEIKAVTQSEDYAAWVLAKDACRAYSREQPEIVCVGEAKDMGYQIIYCI